MKRVTATIHHLPSSPAAAAYNGLSVVQTKAPAKRLKRVDRSAQQRRPRALTAAQRETFLGTAAERVREEAKDRQCKWLRDFDIFQKSGYRTSQKRWDALAELIEPILARMDIATLVLGYLDKDGEFRLNRQRGLAEDTSLQEWTVSRVMGALEKSKMVYRKMRRICYNGRFWITRVTINVRPRFFIQLGLGYQLAEARMQKKAKRTQLLATFGKRRADAMISNAADAATRKQSHVTAQAKRRRQEALAQAQAAENAERARAAAWVAFCSEPEVQSLPMNQRSKLFNQRYRP
ncbi:hypothetical protein FGA82_17975 [Pseudomonas fluorescens]|uniref:hypothetical protein n=1 Tax=Pseudomonas fluorescens TaxID=294 RepID=UPI001130EBDC|nr:hypothetical protein [Pseudomonas fluorescens]TMU77509.1 hypothetical protein FGA82_17975 [Pseudomonas fluorescens]